MIIAATSAAMMAAVGDAVDVADIEHAPYLLEGITVRATVSSNADASAVVACVLRGGSAVVHLELDKHEANAFLDEVRRVADVEIWEREIRTLSDEQRHLLEALRDGVSLGSAAIRLGISRRTADRRLAAARSTLGAATTAEAVATGLDQWPPGRSEGDPALALSPCRGSSELLTSSNE